MHDEKLRHGAVGDGASGSEDPGPAVWLQELTVDNCDQLLEHGACEEVDGSARSLFREGLEEVGCILYGCSGGLEVLEVLWSKPELRVVHLLIRLLLLPQQPQEGTIWGQELSVLADGRLVVGAHPSHELGETVPTDGVAAAEADWLQGGRVIAVGAHRALQELAPARGLHVVPSQGKGTGGMG